MSHNDIHDDPVWFQDTVGEVQSHVQSYGWIILFSCIALVYLLTIWKPKYEKWKKRNEEKKKEAYYSKNPDAALDRMQSVMVAREKMMNDYNRAIERELEKRKQKEERASAQGEGSNLAQVKKTEPKVTDKPKPKLRPEFNPLAGARSGTTYRPAKSCFSAGG